MPVTRARTSATRLASNLPGNTSVKATSFDSKLITFTAGGGGACLATSLFCSEQAAKTITKVSVMTLLIERRRCIFVSFNLLSKLLYTNVLTVVSIYQIRP